MNRSLYRLIFNAARGQIMAVAEVAVSHAAGGSAGDRPRQQRRTARLLLSTTRLNLRMSLLGLCALLTALSLGQTAYAQIVADPNAAATLRPQILNSANGTTQVNIQSPSAAGVSRNVYQQFDVNSQGLILNNATSAVQTQIGGWVQANGNLAGTSARVILNEINASSPSQLRGFVEVAGRRAEVVIANPAGIAVNGGGFINASAITLTTGTPILNSGNLEGYRVTGGSIQILGAGLDTSGADYARVLARAVEVNASVWAQQVKVVTGAHQANADASVVNAIAPEAGAPPAYALDVAALGGMYAGKITLIGTEAGLGVNNAGVLAAGSELVLRADGQLVNRGVLDAQTTRITAGDLQNQGTGRIYGDHVAIQATTLNNAPETTQGVTNAPVIAARERLDIGVGSLVNGLDALLLSGGDLAIGGTLDANQRANGNAQSILNAGGVIEAVGHLHGSADSIRNTNPGFAYEVRSDGSFNGKEYVTGSGIYTAEQVAWVLAENTFGRAGAGGGYRYSSGQGRFLPAGHTYADAKYQPYYNSANAYVAAYTNYNMDYEGNSYPVQVPDSFAYTAGDAIWGVFGLTPPTGLAPGNRPTTTVGECHDGGGCSYNVPTAAEIAAWQTAAAPWLNLQSRLDSFRASVNASAITFTAFRNFSQDIPVAVVTASTPGQMLSGGNMTLYASTELVNDQSRIMAGGTLSVTGQALENRGLDVTATALRSGRSYAWSNFNHGCGNIKGCDYNYNAYRDSAYSVGISQTLSLDHASTDTGSSPISAGLGSSGSLPTGSLFQAAPDPQASYLIETDPLFTSYRSWLSSDYMLQHLGLDPALTQKRLGDGYYEQRLVREQVAQLTGRRFLGEYTSDEQQYLALMNAGVAYAQEHELRPGIALSAEQMADLTSDLVWLVEQTVILDDGRTTSALMPRLYTVARDGDLDGNGALLSARSLGIQLDGEFSSSGRIKALESARISAHDIQLASSGTTDLQAERITLQANRDIHLVGSRVEAGGSLSLQAGRDLTLTTTTASGSSADGNHSVTQIDRLASLSVADTDSSLMAEAGRDLVLTGATITSNGSTGLQAGNNVMLGTVQTTASYNFSGGNATHSDSSRSDVGSYLSSGIHLTVQAASSISATAAELRGDQQVRLEAGQDITIGSGRSEYSYSHSLEVTKSSLFSSSTTRTQVDAEQTRSIASSVEGNTVSLSSNRDTTLLGSNVLADQNVALYSGGSLRIEAAQETSAYRSSTTTHESGLLGGGGLGISIGSREQLLAQGNNATIAAASTVGSLNGDLHIQSKQTYTQIGSDLLTPKGDIDISAQTTNIQEARERSTHAMEQRFRQSGLTFSLAGGMLDTLQATTQAIQGFSDAETDRNKTLNTLVAFGKGFDLYEQGKAVGTAAQKNGTLGGEGQPGAAAASGIKVSISLGSASSQSNSTSISDTAVGSMVKANGNLSIRATGQGGGEGDLTIQGSKVQAGQALLLSATNDLNIVASTDTETNHSDNKSSSTSLGLSLGIGSGGAGLGLDVAASRGKGQANSDSVIYNNSDVSAEKAVIMTSGADTNIRGGHVAGHQVTASVGGNLNMESLQDRASSTARQSNTGIAMSIPIVGAGGNLSASQSKQRSSSNYASVNEQSGIRAEDGGFDIRVEGHTDLKGALIASTDRAIQDGKNVLDTRTLTTSDISNSMSASASSSGISVGSNMLSGKYELGKALIGNALKSGDADQSDFSITVAGISAARVTVGTKTTDSREETLIDSSGKVVESDTSNTHRKVTKADVVSLQQQVQQERTDNVLALRAATALTDPAFKSMFLTAAKIYAIVKDEKGNIVKDGDGKPRFRELSAEEKTNLKPGPDGKVHIANNGIFNGTELDPSAAAKYANQNNKADYFIHFPEASNLLSELLIAAYQKYLESDALGLSNATQEVKSLMIQSGQTGLHLDGHSRGSMTIGNAMESLAKESGAQGILSNTTVNFYGPAYNARQADELLSWLQNRTDMTPEEKDKAMLMFQNHSADPVGGASVVGNNPGTGGTIPQNSGRLVEQARALLGQRDTVHNCYGSAPGKCMEFWSDSLDKKPILQPAQPALLNKSGKQ